jgi:hypothetical protein
MPRPGGGQEGAYAIVAATPIDVGMVVRFDVERFDVATAGKERQPLLEEVLPGGSVQAGGVG